MRRPVNAESGYVDPVVEAYKRDIDDSLLIESLKRTPQERIVEMTRILRFAVALRRAVQRACSSP